jgi:hypothetical protein
MPNWKNVIRTGLVITLIGLVNPVTSTNAAFSPIQGEYSAGVTWDQRPPIGSPQIGNSWSTLAKAPYRAVDPFNTGDTICTTLSDPRCITNGRNVTSNMANSWDPIGTFGYAWIAVLPLCTSDTELNCVVGLSATRDEQQLTTSYKRQFMRGTPFTGDPSIKIPNGGYAPVYSVDGFPSANDPNRLETHEYVVRVTAYGQNRIASCSAPADAISSWCKNKGRKVTDDGYGYPEFRLEALRFDVMRAKQGFDSGPGRTNAPIDIVDLNVDPDVRFTVTARLAEFLTPKGWMHGRLDTPSFTQTPVSGGYQLVIGGTATKVPNPAGQLTCADYRRLTSPDSARARADFEDRWRRQLDSAQLPKTPVCDPSGVQGLNNASNAGFWYNTSLLINRSLTPRASLTMRNDEALQREISWLIALGDKANSISTEWMVEWTPPDTPATTWDASPCISTGLAGIVTTNATMYGELPIFDPQIGALEYAMAGPHYLTDGITENKGTYSLIVARDYVLCEWGIDPANTTMAVTVRYDSGQQQNPPATVTSYDGQFFTLTASGFTFSAPKIRVKPQETKIKKKKTIRAKARSKVSITKVAPQKKRQTTSWYVLSGKCKIDKATPRVLVMPTKGNCKVAVTQFNLRNKKSTRTLLTLST